MSPSAARLQSGCRMTSGSGTTRPPTTHMSPHALNHHADALEPHVPHGTSRSPRRARMGSARATVPDHLPRRAAGLETGFVAHSRPRNCSRKRHAPIPGWGPAHLVGQAPSLASKQEGTPQPTRNTRLFPPSLKVDDWHERERSWSSRHAARGSRGRRERRPGGVLAPTSGGCTHRDTCDSTRTVRAPRDRGTPGHSSMVPCRTAAMCGTSAMAARGQTVSSAGTLPRAERAFSVSVPSNGTACAVNVAFSNTSGTGPWFVPQQLGTGANFVIHSGNGGAIGLVETPPSPWFRLQVSAAPSATIHSVAPRPEARTSQGTA